MLSRLLLITSLAASSVAACSTRGPITAGDDLSGWYIGSIPDQPFDVPLVDRSRMRPEFLRQTVRYEGSERPGTIVVDIDQRFLYLVQEGGSALRYGIGVGRQGFSWRGVAQIGRKSTWPDWGPTRTMVSLNPNLPRFRKGGVDNPLGARALYLHQGGRDTLFRIHGTNEPWSIGDALSSGCVRLLNEDILDLHNRVPVGTTVLVRKNGRWRV